ASSGEERQSRAEERDRIELWESLAAMPITCIRVAIRGGSFDLDLGLWTYTGRARHPVRRYALVHLSCARGPVCRKPALDRAHRAGLCPRAERAHGRDRRRQDGARPCLGSIDGRALAQWNRETGRRGG